MAEPGPFFVIGSPRSGTTLLRLMLTSHPGIVIPPECGFLVWLHAQFGEWTKTDFEIRSNIARFAHAVYRSRKFETWNLDLEYLESEIVQLQPQNYGAACAAVYKLYCRKTGKLGAKWGDKNNHYLSHIATLREIFPDARFVHIVRDGRDVASSYREVMALDSDSPYRPMLPTDIGDIATQWAANVREIAEQLRAMTADAAIALRYEDLVAAPVDELSRLCTWLGLRFSAQMLQFHQLNRANRLEPTATLDWKRRTLEPIDSHTVGRHVAQFTDAEAATFLSIATGELRRFGYLPGACSGGGDHKPTAVGEGKHAESEPR